MSESNHGPTPTGDDVENWLLERPKKIEDTAKDAQKSLLQLAEKLKTEKFDKDKYPPERALEILKFASALTDIAPINDFLKRIGIVSDGKYAFENRKFGVKIAGVSIFIDPIQILREEAAIVLPDKKIRYWGHDFTTDNPLKLSEALRQDWDNGNRGIIKNLAKLNKIDVIKKFQRKIKA